MKTILSYGEALWDLLPSGPLLGGAPLNLAFRIRSLGGRALLVTRLGKDERGKKAFDAIAALGLGTEYVQWDEARPTGTVDVKVDAQGNPAFTIHPETAYDRIETTDALLFAASRADALCFGTLAQRSRVSRETFRRVRSACRKGIAFLDLNLRKDCWTKETVTDSLKQADVVKLNEEEARTVGRLFGLTKGALTRLAGEIRRRWSLTHCLVTLGPRGVVAVTEREELYEPGYQVKVADAIGSGDAFSAGFLQALLARRPLEECVRQGNALGALVAMQPGATGEVSSAALETFLKEPPPRIRDEES